MNKTRKNKYLRKNRHGKNSKHKHKTRKVQRGGEHDDETQVNNSEETVLLLQKSANNTNIMKQQSFPYFKELMRKFNAWLIEKFTPGTADSMKRLEELRNIEQRIESRENSQNVDENIDKFITEFKLILTRILEESLSELKKITNSTNNNYLQKRIQETTDILQQIKNISNENFTRERKKLFESSKEILEKPGLTERFKQGVSNMGKTVKNAATSAKHAVTSRFSRKNENDNKDAEGTELQELSTDKLKEAAQTEPTPTPTEPIKTSTETPNNEGRLAKVRTAFSNFKDRITRKNRETTYSRLPNNDNTKTNEVSQPQPQVQPQGGGNKTRKNRQHQYIHEIKKNRNELFNKEMEIINSIRNFKHGHIDNDNDNTKKQFMNAVKRG